MIGKRLSAKLKSLLPRPVGGTSGRVAEDAMETASDGDSRAAADLAAWRAVRAAVADQPLVAPPANVLPRVMERIRATEPVTAIGATPRSLPRIRSRAWAWAGSAAVALATMALLWSAVRPGTVLAWSATGPVQAFRVYRAAAGTAEFELVDEVPVRAEATEFAIVDSRVWPGAYVYRVEAVGGASPVTLATTETVTEVGAEVLWARLAIVVMGLCLAYVTATMLGTAPRGRGWAAV